MTYSVYILELIDGSYYVGFTNNVDRRNTVTRPLPLLRFLYVYVWGKFDVFY